MSSVSMTEVVHAIQKLPSLPAVITKLRQQIEDNAQTEAIASNLSQDQGLSAKMLRLANSSFYGMQGKIATIPQAIIVLGINQVQALVTAAAISNAFDKNQGGLFDFKAYWNYAVAAGLCARALAKYTRVNPEEAFVAGLLHDIGRLALTTQFHEQYECVLKHAEDTGCTVLQAEEAVLGIDHAAVGGTVVQRWNFPESIRLAVALHHYSDIANQAPLVRNTYAAAAIVRTHVMPDAKDLVTPEALASSARIELTQDALEKIVEDVKTRLEDACKELTS